MVDMERFLSIVYFVGVICCVVYVICDPNFYLHVYLMQFFLFNLLAGTIEWRKWLLLTSIAYVCFIGIYNGRH